MEWKAEDLSALAEAKELLESPGLAAKVADKAGASAEKLLARLPGPGPELVDAAARSAVYKALDAALRTMDETAGKPARERLHRIGAGVAGAAGGLFGLPGLVAELPVSTVIMLRSIADVAREMGEDLSTVEARMACIQVFALGGRPEGLAVETGYFATRAALAKTVSEAARYLAGGGALTRGAPVLVRLVSGIAARYGAVVSEKLAAQSIPVAGCLGGAAVNWMFTDHFQKTARGHFTIRRLERVYGRKDVRRRYEALA
ncbi:MAG: EcsC family protein [Deltaproteobacteria bacterium]|nr:EcsC family protein [Deltaproteobacteria bacterium]